MPGPGHSPKSTDSPAQGPGADAHATTPGLAGVGPQGEAQDLQGGMGNAAAQEMLGDQGWRESGNLIGNPPVRNEKPPNSES